jgi:farnesyl-diphosphate farnesyltransferase
MSARGTPTPETRDRPASLSGAAAPEARSPESRGAPFPGVLSVDPRGECRRLLPGVSRTFALTIRVLPVALRDPVTVAYLLCRLADALEDATGSDPRRRVSYLEALAGALQLPGCTAPELAASLDGAEDLLWTDPASRNLLRRRDAVFRAFLGLPAAEREIVTRWVRAMALGMATFVDRERPWWVEAMGERSGMMIGGVALPGIAGNAGATAGEGTPAGWMTGARVPFVLETGSELRAYAWCVAGTVGHLLTELFARHCGARWPDPSRMRELCTPFGLGLQFTNILQDLAEDRRRGWSYIPEDLARRCGTTVQALDEPEQERAALRVVDELIGEASGYLDQALEYTLMIPRRIPRLRLFCLWPAFFAVRTLARIRGDARVLHGSERLRISRGEVRRAMSLTAALCWSDGGLRALWTAERKRLQRPGAANAAALA